MKMFDFMEGTGTGAKIKVIGIGGGGGNAVDNMIEMGLKRVDFICANTDAQALGASKAPIKLQIGARLTRGRGAGSNPEVGMKAAEEDRERIKEVLTGAEMVFITAGMGGGTGTGGAPVCAEIGKELGALTVAVVTKPFNFENPKRMQQAEEGISKLEKHVDTLICIPNQRLLEISESEITLLDSFKRADEVLFYAVRGISDLITVRGLINLDFSDVRAIMEETGMAIMGTGAAEGKHKGVEAARRAVSSSLLEDVSILGARGVLVNICGGPDLTLHDVESAMTFIQSEAHPDAHIIFGAGIDKSLTNKVLVTVIATGFSKSRESTKPEIVRITTVPPPNSTKQDFDTPTFIRKDREMLAVEKVTRRMKISEDDDSEYDIPTFMRKKAD